MKLMDRVLMALVVLSSLVLVVNNAFAGGWAVLDLLWWIRR